MNITKHAKSRQAQRGISNQDIRLILEHGDYKHRPGCATEYYISSKEAEELFQYHKKMMNVLSKIRGKAALVSSDGAVVTVYRSAS